MKVRKPGEPFTRWSDANPMMRVRIAQNQMNRDLDALEDRVDRLAELAHEQAERARMVRRKRGRP